MNKEGFLVHHIYVHYFFPQNFNYSFIRDCTIKSSIQYWKKYLFHSTKFNRDSIRNYSKLQCSICKKQDILQIYVKSGDKNSKYLEKKSTERYYGLQNWRYYINLFHQNLSNVKNMNIGHYKEQVKGFTRIRTLTFWEGSTSLTLHAVTSYLITRFFPSAKYRFAHFSHQNLIFSYLTFSLNFLFNFLQENISFLFLNILWQYFLQ